ncbi:hypothetical protein Peur_047575 [Populus x canadensis]
MLLGSHPSARKGVLVDGEIVFVGEFGGLVFYGRGGGYGRCVADVGLSGAVLGLVMVFGAAVIGEEKKIKLLVLTAMMVGTVGLICSRVIVFEREGFGGI